MPLRFFLAGGDGLAIANVPHSDPEIGMEKIRRRHAAAAAANQIAAGEILWPIKVHQAVRYVRREEACRNNPFKHQMMLCGSSCAQYSA